MYVLDLIECTVPENTHTSPMESHWKFPWEEGGFGRGGGGYKKAIYFKEMYEANLGFQRGGVGWECGYFLKHHCQ